MIEDIATKILMVCAAVMVTCAAGAIVFVFGWFIGRMIGGW